VNFLLCDPRTLKPVFASEPGDASHACPDRQEQDAFVKEVFAAAKLLLIRIPARQAHNRSELIALFQAAKQKKAVEILVEGKNRFSSFTGSPITGVARKWSR
jgi:hypothetical protein